MKKKGPRKITVKQAIRAAGSASELARQLQVARPTIWRWQQQGRFLPRLYQATVREMYPNHFKK